jgi:hypothetical protein
MPVRLQAYQSEIGVTGHQLNFSSISAQKSRLQRRVDYLRHEAYPCLFAIEGGKQRWIRHG